MIITEKSKIISMVNPKGKRFCYINGDIHYIKEVTPYRMINELIGSYFSKKVELDTVDYEIGKCGEDIYALSKSFHQEGHQYTTFKEYFSSSISSQEATRRYWFSCFFPPKYIICKTGRLDLLKGTEMYEPALKLVAVDLRMGQIDRNNSNLQLTIDANQVPSFAPIYDYGESYIHGVQSTLYRSPYISVRRNGLSLNQFVQEHPKVWDYIDYLLGLSILDVLEEIGDEKEILYTGDEMVNYQRCQFVIDKRLKKIKRFY